MLSQEKSKFKIDKQTLKKRILPTILVSVLIPLIICLSIPFEVYANNLDEIPLYDECYLLIDDVYDLSDISEENSMKKIPLKLIKDNGIIKFDLVYNYFYDSSDGMIYETNETGRRKISKLFLPTTYENEKESIYYEIHLNNLGAGLNNYVFKSYATFDIKWFGNCGSSFFCVQTGDELIDGAHYSGGVRI